MSEDYLQKPWLKVEKLWQVAWKQNKELFKFKLLGNSLKRLLESLQLLKTRNDTLSWFTMLQLQLGNWFDLLFKQDGRKIWLQSLKRSQLYWKKEMTQIQTGDVDTCRFWQLAYLMLRNLMELKHLINSMISQRSLVVVHFKSLYFEIGFIVID